MKTYPQGYSRVLFTSRRAAVYITYRAEVKLSDLTMLINMFINDPNVNLAVNDSDFYNSIAVSKRNWLSHTFMNIGNMKNASALCLYFKNLLKKIILYDKDERKIQKVNFKNDRET